MKHSSIGIICFLVLLSRLSPLWLFLLWCWELNLWPPGWACSPVHDFESLVIIFRELPLGLYLLEFCELPNFVHFLSSRLESSSRFYLLLSFLLPFLLLPSSFPPPPPFFTSSSFLFDFFFFWDQVPLCSWV